MSQELTPEQRLTQMEKLLESTIKLSRKNASQIEANSAQIEANSQAIDHLTVKMAEATDLFLDSIKGRCSLSNVLRKLTDRSGARMRLTSLCEALKAIAFPLQAISSKLFKSRFSSLKIENAVIALRIHQRHRKII